MCTNKGCITMNDILAITILYTLISNVASTKCDIRCPDKLDGLVCAFDIHKRVYKMFPSECALAGYAQCHKADYITTPLKYCIQKDIAASRRMYGESCPVFCPTHYRPVCGASKYRDYSYRTFTNGCYLDMINCRGDDDFQDYVEVPLSFCQKHLMKNIFKEKIIVSDLYDTFRDHFK